MLKPQWGKMLADTVCEDAKLIHKKEAQVNICKMEWEGRKSKIKCCTSEASSKAGSE